MARDFQGFLHDVQARHPELMAQVEAEVDPGHHEAAALLQRMEEAGDLRMVLFRNVRDVEGSPSRFPLVLNLFADRRLCALALGLEPSAHRTELAEEFARRERGRREVVRVKSGQAPCQQQVWRGAEADVRKLPIPMTHEKDVAPYFTMACIMKGLSGEFYDATFTKNMLQGPQRMSLSAHAHHHLDFIVKEHEAAGRRAPVAVVLAHHPAFFLAACALMPYGNDDYASISGFLEEPLRVAPSVTWGDAFWVPADAEIIVEGEVPPRVRAVQNPFGEIAGYYQEPMEMPVMEVTAITFRRDAIFQAMFAGHYDHWNLGGIPKEGSLYNVIKRNVPGLKAVHLPPSGCCRFSCYIALKKQFDNEPRKAALAAFTEMPNLKLAVVVDEDVDIFNEREVQWAVVTRTWWDEDLEVIRKIQSFRGWLGDAVAVIDATRPLRRPFPEKNRIHPQAYRKMDPKAYLR